MPSSLLSQDNMLYNTQTYGGMSRQIWDTYAATASAATSLSGLCTAVRFPNNAPFTVPPVTAPVTGYYMTSLQMFNHRGGAMFCGLEYLLCTIRFINITMTANTGTDFLTVTAHGCANNDFVQFTTSGTLPAPLALATNYYVINKTTNTFQVALTSGGSAIDITTAGSGTQTCAFSNTPGVTMPTKTVRGLSLQTAATRCFGVGTVALVGASTAITVNYTNQSGVAAKSLVVTPPVTTMVANTAMDVYPYLASGDTAIRSIESLSAANATAGTIKFYGYLELGKTCEVSTYVENSSPILAVPSCNFLCEAAETIGFIMFGQAAGTDMVATFFLAPETT